MTILTTLRQAALIWYQRGADQHAAALAYFTPFTLTPLIIFSVTWVGFIVGGERVVAMLLRWGNAVDEELTTLIYNSVTNFGALEAQYTWPLLGAIFLAVMVILALNSFTAALHNIWEIEVTGWHAFFSRLVRIALAIMLIQVYLVLIILFEDTISYVRWWTDTALALFLVFLVTFVSNALLLTLLYGLLPLGAPSFRARLFGGAVACLGLLFSQELVAFHFATAPVQSLFGAAGLIISLLVWVYVSACVILFGAAYAKAYDDRRLAK